jgi:RNA polymerase sigma factor (sigma-70 family)
MSQSQAGTVLHYLRELAAPCASQALTDRQLLERFGAGDQDAFASLVKRHGRLVWDVCRRVLRGEHDAEDAFQAAFLVLACRADSVRRAESLGSWLHGVALRIAMNAKRKAARRVAREHRGARPQSFTADPGVTWSEVQALLDEEVQRLPAASRAVFVLCCMEGRCLADTARELGRTEGATAVALSRARKRLCQRLAERGVALGAVLAAVGLTGSGASAVVPAGLLGFTIRVAARAAAHRAVTAGLVSDQAASLAKAMMKEMTRMSVTKCCVVTAALVAAGVLAGGAAWLPPPASAERPAAVEPPATAGAAGAGGGTRGERPADRIAWGEAVDGLQAGLEPAQGGRAGRVGESAKFIIWVRNAGLPRRLFLRVPARRGRWRRQAREGGRAQGARIPGADPRAAPGAGPVDGVHQSRRTRPGAGGEYDLVLMSIPHALSCPRLFRLSRRGPADVCDAARTP